MVQLFKNLLFCIVIATGITSTLWAKPLQFTQSRYVEEAVPSGELFEGRYPFVNNADTKVCVNSIEASCGCTTASTDRICYDPGQRGELSVVLRGEKAGLNESVVRIYDSNGGLAGELAIAARFINSIAVDPPAIELGEVKAGKHVPFQFELISQIGPGIRGAEFPNLPKGILLTLPKFIIARKRMMIEGSIDTVSNSGASQIHGQITLSDGKQVPVVIPVKYSRPQGFKFFPTILQLGSIATTSATKARVLVTGKSSDLPGISARTNMPGAKIHYTDSPMGREVHFEMTGKMLQETTSPTLTITHLDLPVINIPIMAVTH